ncbi:MAG: hypothetical protein IT534_06000 [Bauldia sp.]|nr:hypothetical protein [Bauldia sp.]
MRGALPEHFAVVGPAWLEFERALAAAGAVGEDTSEQLDSLRGRVSDATLDAAHRLRRQRNALFHDGTLIRDIAAWQSECSRVTADLRSSGSRAAGRRAAPSRPSAARGSPLARLALVLLVAAVAGLGVVAYAWFESAAMCSSSADRLECTFETATWLRTALAAIAALGIAIASFLTRRRR